MNSSEALPDWREWIAGPLGWRALVAPRASTIGKSSIDSLLESRATRSIPCLDVATCWLANYRPIDFVPGSCRGITNSPG
jgi:hypothetical protein